MCLPGAISGGKFWWISPTYLIASEVWHEVKQLTASVTEDKNETERRLNLIGGGEISFRSADRPETLVGVGLTGVVIDEVGKKIKQEVWTESIRPTLADTGGWALLIGTPGGHNWVEELFRRGQADPGWHVAQCPTSQNPFIPDAELQAAKLDMGSAKYAQEFDAQFTDVVGSEFPADWFGDDIWFADWPKAAPVVKTIAVDPSKGRELGDYSAIVSLLVADGRLWVDATIERLPAPRLVTAAVRRLDNSAHRYGSSSRIAGKTCYCRWLPPSWRETAISSWLSLGRS